MNLLLRWSIKRALRVLARRLPRRAFRVPRGGSPRIAYWIAGGIGDAVMALPALAFLRKHFPRSTIDVFVPAAKAGVLAELLRPFSVHRLRPRTVLARTIGGLGYTYSFTNTIGTFRISYDLLSRLSSRCCAGFRYPGETPASRLYDFSLEIGETSHDIDQNLAIVASALGMPLEEHDRAFPTAELREPAARASRATTSVLIHPGAERGYSYKEWPLDRYREIIARLVRRGCSTAVLLGPSETQHYAFFAEIKNLTVSYTHDPASFVKALRGADLFLGNDSGPAHCASRYGIPTITLIGPASPLRTAPRGPHSKYISTNVPCAPCHFKNVPCKNHDCMRSISVDEVWKTIEEMLLTLR